MTPQRMKKQIDKIMRDFDFAFVHRSMVQMNWEWAMAFEPRRVPTIEEIKARARSLLLEVANMPGKRARVETAGFAAWNFKQENLLLQFVLDSAEGVQDS